MLVPASVQVPHTMQPVANFGLQHRSVLSSDRCCIWRHSGRKTIVPKCNVLESSNGAPSGGLVKKRKIVEHIILLRAKPNISDVEEKDMLDYLYTSQYQMRGILAVSLGRIEDPNRENFTHAVFMRFQQMEDVAKFQSSSFYFKILDEHVKPVSYVRLSIF
ncbi:hypothetical protein QOZ80_3BG0297090 [Eleusine coracana subsp. coracana]|nr:hypothetical protein QOZ80_3BG0297090 [Eleusine coracana subsp. coracana]